MLSIVIPTKNEPYLQELVDRVHWSLRHEHVSYEIIVVDDSDVFPCIKGCRTIKQRSIGLGNAVLEGVEASYGTSRFDVVATMDGDGSHNPEYLPVLARLAGVYGIVLGSRYCTKGKTCDSWARRIISKYACAVCAWVLDLNISDPMTGFSAIQRWIYDETKLNPKGYKVVAEILFKNRGVGVQEFPIHFEPRQAGKSKFGFRELFRTGFFVVQLRLGGLFDWVRNLVGGYGSST